VKCAFFQPLCLEKSQVSLYFCRENKRAEKGVESRLKVHGENSDEEDKPQIRKWWGNFTGRKAVLIHELVSTGSYIYC
jgi:hypothetical protein